MTKRSHSTERARARARDLHRGGHTVRGIAEILQREGFRAAKSTVAGWLASPSSPDTAAPADASGDPGQSALVRPPLEIAREAAAELGRRRPKSARLRELVAELVAALERAAEPVVPDELLEDAVRDLRDLAAVAKASGALPAFSTIQRTLNQTLTLCERLRPPPPPDPSANPDVVATAAGCRRKLHELLDGALAARGDR